MAVSQAVVVTRMAFSMNMEHVKGTSLMRRHCLCRSGPLQATRQKLYNAQVHIHSVFASRRQKAAGFSWLAYLLLAIVIYLKVTLCG